MSVYSNVWRTFSNEVKCQQLTSISPLEYNLPPYQVMPQPLYIDIIHILPPRNQLKSPGMVRLPQEFDASCACVSCPGSELTIGPIEILYFIQCLLMMFFRKNIFSW